jgi:hypothetical protein
MTMAATCHRRIHFAKANFNVYDSSYMQPRFSHMQDLTTSLLQTKSTLLRACAPADAPALAWPMVCGSRVAERTKPAAFESGVLTIIVPDKAWRSELSDLAPRYVAELNKISPVQIKLLLFITPEQAKQDSQPSIR